MYLIFIYILKMGTVMKQNMELQSQAYNSLVKDKII